MQVSSTPVRRRRRDANGKSTLGGQVLAISENELASRWGLAPKTLRRWRQESLGPVFSKFGSRVAYLLSEVEAFEAKTRRNATFASACR